MSKRQLRHNQSNVQPVSHVYAARVSEGGLAFRQHLIIISLPLGHWLCYYACVMNGYCNKWESMIWLVYVQKRPL